MWKLNCLCCGNSIFYFLFWWNIWRKMTSYTSLFRVLLLKSKHKQFSYTCVGWINRSQDNLFMFCCWRSSYFAEPSFTFLIFCQKILNTLHQIYTTFQILREYSNIGKVSIIFCGQTIKRNLKLLIFRESWIVCVAETFLLFSVLMQYLTKYDVRYTLISCFASQIKTYAIFLYLCWLD